MGALNVINMINVDSGMSAINALDITEVVHVINYTICINDTHAMRVSNDIMFFMFSMRLMCG